jgi:peptide/nickel transport system substrate-binding protein
LAERRPAVKLSRRILKVVVVALALALAATASAQQRGGTLRIAYTSITQLDPYKTAANDEINAASLVFDPLFIIGKDDFQPVPHLAESWEAIDDTTWEFKLRRGVMFQDGNEVFPEGQAREVTAHDVVYSVNRFLEVSTAFTLGDITGVEAVDDYTVRITTAAPDPFLVTDVNRLARVVVVPHEAVEHFGEEGFARNPIGSGPFELRSFTADQSLTFERNEDYWLDPYLDRVEFLFIPDPTVQTIAVEAGEVDVVPYLFNIDSVAQLQETPGIVLHPRGGSYRGLGINVTTPPFDEFEVRDAISKAIDIDAAVAAVVEPFGLRAYGQVPPWVSFEQDPSLSELWEYDPEEALEILASVGFTPGANGVLQRDGQPLKFSIKTIAGSQVRVLTILVTQLQELGIDASLQQQDTAVWAEDLQTGNDTSVFFDYSFAGTTGLYSLFHSSNAGMTNTHFYANPEVDRLLDEASRTVEFGERNRLWLEAQRLIIRDRAAIPLYFEFGYSVASDRVHDWVVPWGGLHLVSLENNVWVE